MRGIRLHLERRRAGIIVSGRVWKRRHRHTDREGRSAYNRAAYKLGNADARSDRFRAVYRLAERDARDERTGGK